MLIYVVDPDHLVASTVEEFLVDIGHDVVTYSTISQCFVEPSGRFRSPDVVLTEMRSVEGDKNQIFYWLHRSFPEAYVLLMSKEETPLSAQEAVDYGVFGYVRKPVRFKELELLLFRCQEGIAWRKRAGAEGCGPFAG